jgi:hypothetical protein
VAGLVETAEAQSSGILEDTGKAIGIMNGILTMFNMDLIALLFLPIDIPLFLFSFTGTGTLLTEMIIKLLTPLIMLIPALLYVVLDIFGISGILKGYLEGTTSSIIWFLGKWTYLSRVMFLSEKRAVEVMF